MKKQLWIPPIGSIITLAEDWEFPLFYEHRNDKVMMLLGVGKPKIENQGWTWHDVFDAKCYAHGERNLEGNYERFGPKSEQVILKKGTKLKLDRIYIRKGEGMKDFDSVTFYLHSSPNIDKKKKLPKQLKGAARFWAKLTDVNRIVYEAAK